jgi:hypothetical protein
MKIRDVPQTGSLGETVTYQNRYGIIRRRKTIPRNPRTNLQQGHRSAFQRARLFWGTLTDEQMLAWDVFAKTRHTSPSLGESAPLSGYELAIQVNVHLAAVGLPMTPTPNPVPIFPTNPVVGLTAAMTGDATSLQLQLSGPPVQYVVVFGACPKNPGVRYVDHFALLGLLPEPQGNLVDIADLYLARFKLLRPGQRIFIRTLQQINGWRDLPQTVSARVLAL